MAALSFALLRNVLAQFIWPSVSAKVIGHKPYFSDDGWLLVSFRNAAGEEIETSIGNRRDSGLFLSKHPIGSTLEIFYNPRKPSEASIPISLPATIFGTCLIVVINYGFIVGVLHAWQP